MSVLCDPLDYTVHGILQARILEWVVFPFSRGSSDPGIEPRSPALQVASLPAESQGKPKNTGVGSLTLLQQIIPNQESNRGFLHCTWFFTNWAIQPETSTKQHTKPHWELSVFPYLTRAPLLFSALQDNTLYPAGIRMIPKYCKYLSVGIRIPILSLHQFSCSIVKDSWRPHGL